jgi:NAD(P)-dependent dehydrogenase (short-subunit alcohol dehydrogenase family)
MKLSVLLTGAAGDIGTAISRRLVSLGYGVIGLDKTAPTGTDTYLDFFVTNLTHSDQLSDTCNHIRQKHCPLWGLIHCAGVYPIVPLSAYTADLWDEVQSVNLRSAFQIVRDLQSDLSNGGRIVFVSSGAAHLGSGDIGYSTSKAGLVGLARGLAKSLASKGILVNSVCPGLITSQMSARMSPEQASKTEQAVPLARPGSPEEVSICVSFLLDPENSYMTGATIDVNGGLYMP